MPWPQEETAPSGGFERGFDLSEAGLLEAPPYSMEVQRMFCVPLPSPPPPLTCAQGPQGHLCTQEEKSRQRAVEVPCSFVEFRYICASGVEDVWDWPQSLVPHDKVAWMGLSSSADTQPGHRGRDALLVQRKGPSSPQGQEGRNTLPAGSS